MVNLPVPPKRRPIPERPVIIQSGELCLEGLYISKKGENLPVVLNSPHPKLGGSMDASLLNEIAYVLARLEVSSLRFNYRGVGASQGIYTGGEGEVGDLAAAIDFLLESFYAEKDGALTCAGYSFGAWIGYLQALKDPRIKRLLLLAPAIKKFDFSRLPEVKTRVGILVGGRDELCVMDDLKNFLADLQKKNPKWQPPAVFEIPEANHYFVRGLSEAGRLSAGFLTTGRFVDPEGTPDLANP